MYWDQSDGVKLYVATVTCSTGKTLQCNTTNSTCQFSNLYCGKVYEFSVTAYSDMCSSEISSTVGIQTGREPLSINNLLYRLLINGTTRVIIHVYVPVYFKTHKINMSKSYKQQEAGTSDMLPILA